MSAPEKKKTPDTEASGGGVVKPALPAESPENQFNVLSEKFKCTLEKFQKQKKESVDSRR